jgi:hypothetical protein
MLQGSGHGDAPHMSQMGENVGYPPHVGCEEMAYSKPFRLPKQVQERTNL